MGSPPRATIYYSTIATTKIYGRVFPLLLVLSALPALFGVKTVGLAPRTGLLGSSDVLLRGDWRTGVTDFAPTAR